MADLLTKSDLFSLNKRRYRKVDLLGGGKVRIQSLTGSEIRRFKSSLITKRGQLDRRRADHLDHLLIAQCLVDEGGKRMLTDEEALGNDFGEIDGGVLAHLVSECKEHTGFSADDDFAAIEDEIKNSSKTGDDSSS